MELFAKIADDEQPTIQKFCILMFNYEDIVRIAVNFQYPLYVRIIYLRFLNSIYLKYNDYLQLHNAIHVIERLFLNDAKNMLSYLTEA